MNNTNFIKDDESGSFNCIPLPQSLDMEADAQPALSGRAGQKTKSTIGKYYQLVSPLDETSTRVVSCPH